MKHIAIISASVREGRLSHRIALFIQQYIEQNNLATAEILDLKAYDFPLFTERYMFLDNPSEKARDYVERFNHADGIIIVSPVYNASFPASLKNVIDFLVKDWKEKVVAVSAVTYGGNAGVATVKELQSLLLKMGAWVVPTAFMPLYAGEQYDEEGNAKDKEKAENYIQPFINQVLEGMAKLDI